MKIAMMLIWGCRYEIAIRKDEDGNGEERSKEKKGKKNRDNGK